MCVGEGGGGCAAHHRSQLPLDTENPIFFLIVTARALSPHSLLLLGGTMSPPMLPDSCLLLPTPRRTLPPLSVTRVGTHHISCPQLGGAGGADGPRPKLPDEIVLFRGG